MPSKAGYHYSPAPNDRAAASQAPHAYQTTPSPAKSRAGVGRLGGEFRRVSGGGRQTGGKRRRGGRP